jgi:hypothetical protein
LPVRSDLPGKKSAGPPAVDPPAAKKSYVIPFELGELHVPIVLLNSKGQPLMLFDLIHALKKAGAFNQAKATQLEAWSRIRNHAAHGEFDQFGRQDIGDMVKVIKEFIATYLE